MWERRGACDADDAGGRSRRAKNNPPFQKKDGLQKPEYVQEQYCLTLRELRTLASFLQAVLLALNHTWVTRKQTRLFQLGAIFAS